jgi:death on curing protein
MTIYVTLIEALAIHEDQIARYGGAFGLRDMGMLEPVAFRLTWLLPRST